MIQVYTLFEKQMTKKSSLFLKKKNIATRKRWRKHDMLEAQLMLLSESAGPLHGAAGRSFAEWGSWFAEILFCNSKKYFFFQIRDILFQNMTNHGWPAGQLYGATWSIDNCRNVIKKQKILFFPIQRNTFCKMTNNCGSAGPRFMAQLDNQK